MQGHFVGFDANGIGMLFDDVRSVHVPIPLVRHVRVRTRVEQITGFLLEGRHFRCWSRVKFVRAEHLIVVEEKDEKLIDDCDTARCLIGRMRVVHVEEKMDPIRVALTFIAVILWWAETNG